MPPEARLALGEGPGYIGRARVEQSSRAPPLREWLSNSRARLTCRWYNLCPLQTAIVILLVVIALAHAALAYALVAFASQARDAVAKLGEAADAVRSVAKSVADEAIPAKAGAALGRIPELQGIVKERLTQMEEPIATIGRAAEEIRQVALELKAAGLGAKWSEAGKNVTSAGAKVAQAAGGVSDVMDSVRRGKDVQDRFITGLKSGLSRTVDYMSSIQAGVTAGFSELFKKQEDKEPKKEPKEES